jgi:hypothetical protein
MNSRRPVNSDVRCLVEKCDPMILPMFGLIATLLVVGGLATLVAVGDPKNARLAPYVGFVSLFAAFGALLLSVFLGLIGEAVIRSDAAGALGSFIGFAFGGIGGALFGFDRAYRRRRRIDSDVHE